MTNDSTDRLIFPTKLIPEDLFDELLPFTISFNKHGKVVNVSLLLMKIWKLDGDNPCEVLNTKLKLTRPFEGSLQTEWFTELTDLILYVVMEGFPDVQIRGQIYPHENGWLFTGFPLVSSIHELESLGLHLSQLPVHTSMGELLIANEASAATLLETKKQASQISKTNETLSQLNERFTRFVPSKFLENIGIRTPLEMETGRHVETRKAVMFVDLLKFTTLSEQLGTSRTFEVINRFLKTIVPCIESHGGYVVQYLGDGVMALFPGNSLSGLKAAVDMQIALKKSLDQFGELPVPLRMSIGIHEGPVALGIIGNESRWDASIISDAVNTSSRIESMTRVLGGEIIVSRQFLECGDSKETYATRCLGVHDIRGRKSQLELVEVLNSLDAEERKEREDTASDFESGLSAYQAGDLYGAMSCFSRVLSTVPDDLAAQFYLAQISQRL